MSEGREERMIGMKERNLEGLNGTYKSYKVWDRSTYMIAFMIGHENCNKLTPLHVSHNNKLHRCCDSTTWLLLDVK